MLTNCAKQHTSSRRFVAFLRQIGADWRLGREVARRHTNCDCRSRGEHCTLLSLGTFTPLSEVSAMKNALVILAGIAMLGVACYGVADEKKPEDGKHQSVLMKKKLEYTQQILTGLANEDFDSIAKHAKILNTFGSLEQWFRADCEAYRAQLKIFRFANSELIRLAEEKNLEGASLAYMQLTMSCVNCHSHIRRNSK